jgi:lipoprotein-anchoring transpeptidase ErfK/SrfK
MKILTWAVLFFAGLNASAQAQQSIIVDFSTGLLWHLYGDEQQDTYPVVLPRMDVQQTMNFSRPVLGQLKHADYKPTWWPTASMRHDDPSLPRRVEYGQSRHPIGLYRLRIFWINPTNPAFWGPVRIHGGARIWDLRRSLSAGCVRMMDEDIERLVNNIDHAKASGQTGVRIAFGFFNE